MNIGITGLGFATPIGVGEAAVVTSLRELRSGIRRVDLVPGTEVPIKIAGTVEGFDLSDPEPLAWTLPDGIEIERGLLKTLPPHGVYALVALREALAQSGLSEDEQRDGRTGLHAASAGSPRLLHHHLSRFEQGGWQRAHPAGIVSSIAGTLNFNLGVHLGIRGSNCGFVSACTSGGHALGHAFDEIVLGRQDRMLVVAAEDCTAESILPFDAMRALCTSEDPEGASRPFDQARNGFVASGGAVALVLERDPADPPLAWMRGWAQAGDGHSIAIPHPEGEGIGRAMELALKAAGIGASEVDYLSAHATSTPAGDRAEALAIRRVLGEGSRASVSSTKGITGHGLSFSALLEAAVCVLALRKGFVPGNANLTDPDPACEGLHLPTKTLDNPIRIALNNSSGFGGSNVVHVLSR